MKQYKVKEVKIGQRFGSLNLKRIDKVANKKGVPEPVAVCKCTKCNETKSYSLYQLTNGVTRTCSCSSSAMEGRMLAKNLVESGCAKEIHKRYLNQVVSFGDLANIYKVPYRFIASVIKGERGLPKVSSTFIATRKAAIISKRLMTGSRTRKLTIEQVHKIRKDFDKYPIKELAVKYGVTVRQIYIVGNRIQWKGLK